MDPELRDRLVEELDSPTPEEFASRYIDLHRAKYGTLRILSPDRSRCHYLDL